MKKALGIIAAVLVILIAIVAIFAVTFDIDRYRPQITEQISKAVGNPVSISKIKLSFQNGIGLQVHDFAIYKAGSSPANPELSAKELSVSLQVAPLLARQVKVRALRLIKPLVHVVRDASGKVSIAGIDPVGSGQAPAPQVAGQAKPKASGDMPVVVSIEEISMQDAVLRFTDLSPTFPMDVNVRDLDFKATNVALDRDIRFEAAFDLFSKKQNVTISGMVDGLAKKRPRVSNFNIKTDLADIDTAVLRKELPALAAVNIEGSLQGTFEIKAKSVQLTETGLESFDAGVDIQKVSLNQLLLLAKKQTRLDGIFSFQFEGNGRGADWNSISQTLTGNGALTLEKGVILNGNPLKEVIDRMGVIPGFVDAVNKHVPEAIKEKINAPVTPIVKPIQAKFSVDQGRVTVEKMTVPTELFVLEADIQIALAGAMEGTGLFIIGNNVVQPIVDNEQAVSYLVNKDKTISMPIRFSASPGGFSVMPDLDKFGAKAVIDKGREFIQGLLADRGF